MGYLANKILLYASFIRQCKVQESIINSCLAHFLIPLRL